MVYTHAVRAAIYVYPETRWHDTYSVCDTTTTSKHFMRGLTNIYMCYECMYKLYTQYSINDIRRRNNVVNANAVSNSFWIYYMWEANKGKKTGFRKQLFLWYIKEFGLVVVGVLEGNPTVDKKIYEKDFFISKSVSNVIKICCSFFISNIFLICFSLKSIKMYYTFCN